MYKHKKRRYAKWLARKPRYEECEPTRAELTARLRAERSFLPYSLFKKQMNSVGFPANIKHYTAHIASSITTSFGKQYERLAWILIMPKKEIRNLQAMREEIADLLLGEPRLYGLAFLGTLLNPARQPEQDKPVDDGALIGRRHIPFRYVGTNFRRGLGGNLPLGSRLD